MIGFHGRHPSDELQSQLERTQARAVILYARNVESASQTRELIAGIRERVPWPLLIAVDQEGGPVVRVQRGGTLFPGNMALGACDRVDLARRQGIESGRQLSAMGFDLNLAPVVDLQTNPKNPGIGIRSLGADRSRAFELALALVEGHRQHGVHCCLKHFPGKGAASVDAHRDLPVLELPIDQFRDPHLRIFEELLARLDPSPAIMTSHVIVTGLDPEAPATLSPKVTRQLLRQALGFEGLLLTDDLEMGAIVKHGGIGPAALAAARASHDVVLVCHDAERQLEAATALERALASGELDAAEHARAVGRIEAYARSAAQARSSDPIQRERPGVADPSAGDEVAAEIARQAVHRFADRRGLLPLSREQSFAVLAFRPRAIVDVEETGGAGAFEAALRTSFARAGLTPARLRVLESTERSGDDVLECARDVDRVVFYTWDALRQAPVRELLLQACRSLGERLIVVHLRNPFDQTLLPEGTTSLTAFGYHSCQLDALAEVIAGRSSASGRLPAPLVSRG